MVEPPRTHLKLPCWLASPSSTVVRGGSVWSNHLQVTRNYPVGLLPQTEKWFEEVRCGRTTLNSFKMPCRPASPCITVVQGGSVRSNHPELTRNCPIGLPPNASHWFVEVQCGRTTPNSLETALQACFPLHHSGSRRFGTVEPPRTYV